MRKGSSHRGRWHSEHKVTPEGLRTWEQEIRDALEKYNSWLEGV